MTVLPAGAAGRRLLSVVVVLAALAVVSAAPAAAPTPDAHDRALAQRLAAEVSSLTKLGATSNGVDNRITKDLKGCTGLGKTPGDSFAVVFAMLPVVLIDAVNQFRPEFLQVRATIAPMRPHATLFRRWLAGELAGLDQILAFDNHGKKIDFCAAAKVMLAKSPKDADVRAVLGLSLARIQSLFSGPSAAASAAVTKLNPPMRAFLLAAGVRRSVAVQLTK